MIAPVTEQVLAEETLLTRRGFQETCRDDLVGIDILQRKGHTRARDDIKFLFHKLLFTLKFVDL